MLGTGLGRIVDDMQDAVTIPFAEIPGFPQGEVSGHARQLSYGTLYGKKVLIFQGRAHYYESGDAAVMRVPLGMLTAFGSPPLVLTNAAGSLKPDLQAGRACPDHRPHQSQRPQSADRGCRRRALRADGRRL